MRDYGKVSPKFWTGNTGREIRQQGQGAQLAALYLMTAPGSTMLGVYYLPLPTLSHAIGSSIEGALEALRSLSEVGFCTYDEVSEWVWVHEMAAYQIDEALDPKDNRVKSVAKEWLGFPQLPFLQGFFDRYREAFHLPERRGSKAPLKPLRSQEQEQEKEQEQEQETAKAPAPGSAVADPPLLSPVEHPLEFPLPVAVVSIPTNVGDEFPIYQPMVEEFERAYPAVDVLAQLRAMRVWSISNPRLRKTRSGMPRFINGWLAKEQNQPRKSVAAVTGQAASRPAETVNGMALHPAAATTVQSLQRAMDRMSASGEIS